MKFDTLYKRTKTGAIQVWAITVTKILDNLYLIEKESGQLGTNSPIIHKEHVEVGKQKRSVQEQAEAQASSDWKKKKDEGYKTTKDLCPIGELNGPMSEGDFFEKYLPKFNTDAAGNIKPMLATDWKKIKKVQYPCYCEPKLDGVRCLMIVSGEEEPEIKFLSRSGKEYNTLSHIAQDIIHAWSPAGRITSGFILDGEIYSDELTFQEIVSAVKAYKPNSEKLHFRAYDIVTDEPQDQRRDASSQLVKKIDSEFISHITWFIADGDDEVNIFHDQFVQKGQEGAILRMFDGKYAQGQRSRELLKVKEFDETEFTTVGFRLGQRGIEDLILSCSCKGGTFDVKMSGSLTIKQKLWAGIHTAMNKKLTVKHFGYTESGLPRFPIGKSIRDYD